MNVAIGISGLIFSAAITPGPNNLVVLQLAGARGAASAQLVLPLLFVVISSASLLAWAILGHMAVRVLRGGLARARFDRVTGALLIASAGSLALGGI
jgi:threonine/homoserine/homoserine lactone efflux protein